MKIVISESALDTHQLSSLIEQNHSVGAVASFTGLMRDNNLGDSVAAMYLDHYPGMTESVLANIAGEAGKRWPIVAGLVAHRVGAVKAGEVLVYVEMHSAHRQDAFDACNYVMDILKTEAPFWKRETTEFGERWVDSRQSDHDALEKWQ